MQKNMTDRTPGSYDDFVAYLGTVRTEEELLGQRPAGCERQRSRRWEPQPGLVERSETERLY